MNRKLKVCKLWEIENIQILEKFLIFPHFDDDLDFLEMHVSCHNMQFDDYRNV
jgi:hypothetical protein